MIDRKRRNRKVGRKRENARVLYFLNSGWLSPETDVFGFRREPPKPEKIGK